MYERRELPALAFGCTFQLLFTRRRGKAATVSYGLYVDSSPFLDVSSHHDVKCDVLYTHATVARARANGAWGEVLSHVLL